jgi:hypothetical protein
MPKTNRDLAMMRELIDYEMLRLTLLRNMPMHAPRAAEIAEEISKLRRERIALCAAIINRRAEASRSVVSLSRWASGNGALAALRPEHRQTVAAAGCNQPISLGIVNAAGVKSGSRLECTENSHSRGG